MLRTTSAGRSVRADCMITEGRDGGAGGGTAAPPYPRRGTAAAVERVRQAVASTPSSTVMLRVRLGSTGMPGPIVVATVHLAR